MSKFGIQGVLDVQVKRTNMKQIYGLCIYIYNFQLRIEIIGYKTAAPCHFIYRDHKIPETSTSISHICVAN